VANDLPEGVAETAVGAAMMRARESARVDRLFDDPYAAVFVAAVPPIFEDGPTPADDPAVAELEAAFEEVVAIRTRFFDDFVTDAVTARCRQVVLVGAGLDTRAFRLDWPEGSRLFELDRPDVLNFKDSVLAKTAAHPPCQRVTVPVDLRQHGWRVTLVKWGFDRTRPTAWVIEGMLPYLTNTAAERLLDAVGALSSPDSRLAAGPCRPGRRRRPPARAVHHEHERDHLDVAGRSLRRRIDVALPPWLGNTRDPRRDAQ
jgi:methyltransferase (TIGR00027 family)